VVSPRVQITARHQPEPRPGIVGADAGIGNNLLIVMRPDGAIAEKVPNPRALRASLTDLRRANRALARTHEGSSRWRKAKRTLARPPGKGGGMSANEHSSVTESRVFPWPGSG